MIPMGFWGGGAASGVCGPESKEGKGVMVRVSRMASGGCANSIFDWGVKNQDASSFLPVLHLRPLVLDAPFPPFRIANLPH